MKSFTEFLIMIDLDRRSSGNLSDGDLDLVLIKFQTNRSFIRLSFPSFIFIFQNQVKEFIQKFHSDTRPMHFTCQSQLDYIDDTTTHLIIQDFGSYTTHLTKQIIQACVRHVFIASIEWISSSLNQSILLDQFPYEILRDDKSLPNTRGIKQCRFDHLPVFPSSYIFSIECHSKLKSLPITREELFEILDLSGATLVHDHIECDTLIILCNNKKEMLTRKKLLTDTHVIFCKPYFLFDSIVRHEIQPIEKYLW